MKKQRSYLIIAFFLVLITGIFFYYNEVRIPQVRIEMEKTFKEDAVWVLTATNEIEQSTRITEDIINNSIDVMLVPKDDVEGFLVKGAITATLDTGYFLNDDVGKKSTRSRVKQELIENARLKGKFTTETLSAKEQILRSSIDNSGKSWATNDEKLKDYEVSNFLAGTLEEGQEVDVLVNLENGAYEVVAAKKRVEKLIAPDESGTNDPAIIILSVNEKEYRDLNMAEGLGKLELRKYNNSEQPAARVTFSYEQAKNLVLAIMDSIERTSSGTIDSQIASFKRMKYSDKMFIKWYSQKDIDLSSAVKKALDAQAAADAAAKPATTMPNGNFPLNN
ncbi:MAG: hypothetical protein N4A47_00195 [Clostridia bacterium]|jgi:hypothetical protein|nr:hypothetical protein [Clostridia bacterium]